MKLNNLLLIFIIVIAFLLRIYGIRWGLPNKNYYFSYNSDEVNYLRGLSKMSPKEFDFNPRYFNWGTGHYYELGIIFGLAGSLKIIKLSKDKNFYYAYPRELAKIYLIGRFLSVFFALATVFLLYLIVKKMYGEKMGLLAAFFMAINPAHAVHSHYLKADTSVTFWITLLLLSCIYLLETGKLKWYILAGLSSALAFGAQHSGLCFMHSIFVAHLLRAYNAKDNYLFLLKKCLKSKEMWFGYCVAIIVYLSISPYIYLDFAGFSASIYGVFTRQSGGIDLEGRANLLIDTIKYFDVGLTIFFVILSGIGLFFALINRSRKILLILFWLLPYLIIMIISGALETRYQMLIYPGLFLLICGFIHFFYSKAGSKFAYYLLSIYVIVSSFLTLVYTFNYDKLFSEKTIQQESSEWIIKNLPAKTTIGIPSNPEVRNYPEVIHQDYYKKNCYFEILNFNSSLNLLRQAKPDYLIISRIDYFSVNLTGNPISSKDFIKEITDNYAVLKIFKKYPEFGNILLKPGIFISDWEMPFPSIYILKRKNKDGLPVGKVED